MLKLKSVNFEQQKFQNHQLEPYHAGQLEWLIGRKTTCDLVLSCPEVSRVHGRIIYTNDAYHFIDAGSTSGSLLNGEIVANNDQRQLCPGDLIQIGKTFLYVEELLPPTAPSSVHDTFTGHASNSQPQWTEDGLLCRCCRIVEETPDVKTFYLVAEPSILFSYKPGQFVNLEVEIDNQRVIRPYSISSSPTRPNHLSITVKRVASPADQPDVPAGLVSNWLHDHFNVGDRIKIVGKPMGHFTCLPDVPPKLLLISAGSGITPMISMTRWVQDTLADSDILFFHSARTLEDIVFRSELEAIAAQMPNFHLAVTVTQEPKRHPWMGFTGRVSHSMLHLIAPDLLERAVYVCGPEGFRQSIKSMLEEMNFPMQQYQEESFGGKKVASSPTSSNPEAKLRSQPSDELADQQPESTLETLDPKQSALMNAAPVVKFIKSERDVTADGSTSILELAEQEGIPIRNACRVGACGACKVLSVKGSVRYDMPPMALTPADKDAGCVLACVAYPVEPLEIDA